MDQIVNFENCKYLVITFGERTDHIGLSYSDISLITSNLLSMFKSQNFAKLEAIECEMFEKIPEMEETIGNIISMEHLLDPNTEIKVYNQNLNKIRELTTFFKKTVESKSIFRQLIKIINRLFLKTTYMI
jgi:hypothetical protein